MFYLLYKNQKYMYINVLENLDLNCWYSLETWLYLFLYLFFLWVVFTAIIYHMNFGVVFWIIVFSFAAPFLDSSLYLSNMFFVLSVWLSSEFFYPFFAMNYLIIIVMADKYVEKLRFSWGGGFNTYYFFIVSTAIMLGLGHCTGLMPFHKIFTGYLMVAFLFFLSYLAIKLLMSFFIHGMAFFNLFLSKNTSLLMAPLLMGMKFFFYILQVFRSVIRLVANLVAGHLLLKFLMIFLWKILEWQMLLGFPSVYLLLSLLMVMMLEVVVNMLQVFMFNILFMIYITNIMDLH